MLSEGDASDMMAETCREAVSGDGDIRIAYYTFSSDQECRRAYEKNRYTTMPAHIETNGTDTQQKKRKRSRRENSWGLRLPACG
ncbi:MAG: hypothetical protein ACOYBC_01670 [Bilifractor sp.]